MTRSLIRAALGLSCLMLAGCHARTASVPGDIGKPNPHDEAIRANHLFLNQKTFDPWVLTRTSNDDTIPAYIAMNGYSYLIDANRNIIGSYTSGAYVKGRLVRQSLLHRSQTPRVFLPSLRTLDLYHGTLSPGDGPPDPRDVKWPRLWQTSDIMIDGDPEAQQVTHANIFYLLSSTFHGSTDSIPPMGLSSDAYGGHIFWDADVWMLPAILPQHPDYARSIVDYRAKLLAQARRNAKAHGYAGAEFPWESADTGREEAPPGFAQERHITADVAFAAWQFYLWTGDKTYLKTEGWPVLHDTAQYWTSRVRLGKDGNYHIKGVLGPDETAGIVDDDAYTLGVVSYNFHAAIAAAHILHLPPDPRWHQILNSTYFPLDERHSIVAENDNPITDRFQAKQADALLILYPLGFHTDTSFSENMLDFYSAHTIPTGPAMTSSIESIVAAQLGRKQQSLDFFHDSYRPFERGPWDAFSEKRTTNNVYFLTGMAGCIQSVLYGFAGLQIVSPWEQGQGQKLASDGDIAFYCRPHLPPGWGKLILKGVRFHGHVFNLSISPDNAVTVTPAGRPTKAPG